MTRLHHWCAACRQRTQHLPRGERLAVYLRDAAGDNGNWRTQLQRTQVRQGTAIYDERWPSERHRSHVHKLWHSARLQESDRRVQSLQSSTLIRVTFCCLAVRFACFWLVLLRLTITLWQPLLLGKNQIYVMIYKLGVLFVSIVSVSISMWLARSLVTAAVGCCHSVSERATWEAMIQFEIPWSTLDKTHETAWFRTSESWLF